MFIFLIFSIFFINSVGMDIPLEPRAPQKDFMPPFEPSELATRYKPLVNKLPNSNLESVAPDIPLAKKYAFVECMNQLRPNIRISDLKYFLDDPILIEAVLAYAQPYTLRNEYIRLFYFASLMWEKDEIYSLLLDRKIDYYNLRSNSHETPAEFVRRLNKERS